MIAYVQAFNDRLGSMCQRGEISEAIKECWEWNDTLSMVVLAGDQL